MLALLALLSAVGLTGCATAPQSMLDPAGPVAATQRELLNFDLLMVTGIGVIVLALILYVILRFRHRPGDDSLPKQVTGNKKLEIGWTLAAVLVLIPLAVEPIGATFALAEKPTGPNVLNVKIIGHQWWWEYQYPDLNITTANELIIPAGVKVSLMLTSADVNHSFWVPRLAGKMDALPGRINQLWMAADEPGTYSGQCAELCGTSHANMRTKVIVKTAAEFQDWVKARQTKVDVTKLSDRAQAGWKTFNDKSCFACHTVEGTTANGKVGPNLTGVGSRTSIASAMLENTDEFITKWLHDPQSVKPRTQMPNLNLTAAEIDNLKAFIKELK